MPQTALVADQPGLSLQPLGAVGLQALAVENQACTALLSLQGAQILAFQAAGQAPLLWCSEQAVYQPGRAIRGGIPLCFPWFGDHPSDPALPAHGFARLLPWALCEVDSRPTQHRLRFELASSAQTRALWPHDFLAQLEFTLGAELELRFSLHNRGSTLLSCELALHSYFAVQNIAQLRVEGLEGLAFADKLQPEAGLGRESQALRLGGETDRVYQGLNGCLSVVDEVAGRRIQISAQGGGSAIVWNPGPEKSARLADMGDAAWRQMLCVESGQVAPAAWALAPGQSATLTLRLQVDEQRGA